MAVLTLAVPGQSQMDPGPEMAPVYGPIGFYPTEEEVDLLGGESHDMYRRSLGDTSIDGPDAGSLTASGIWHQDFEPTESYFERNDGFFTPLDNVLGVLAPRELMLMEAYEPRRARLYGYADPGFLMTRNFNPDLATFKLGPLYLDLISLSGTVLYSDYSGRPALTDDDGWLSAIELKFRAYARLTQYLYLSMAGNFYYLPGENKFGFYPANGYPSLLRIAYENTIGTWDFTIYDEFTMHHRLSEIFDEVEHDEIDRAGRYRFGRLDSNGGSDYYDDEDVFFVNRLGVAFHGPIGDVLDATLALDHYDYWDSFDFEHVNEWDRLLFHVDYTGSEWAVIPYFEYQLSAHDEWEQIHHSIWLGARAYLTDNIRFDGRVGYHISDGKWKDDDGLIGDLGLVHDLTENTSHSLYAGVRHEIWDDGEDAMASYVRYSLAHAFGPRLRGTAFVQYSDLDDYEDFGGVSEDRNGWSAGARISAFISDYTHCTLGAYYDEWHDSSVRVGDHERWIYRATLQQRLLPYLHARFTYQYEDYEESGINGFDEQLFMLSLDYLF